MVMRQETMKKFKNGDTKISLDNLNRSFLCAVSGNANQGI